MKVVHLCLSAFFPDGYSYQENMLPKFHKQAGNEVEIIASLRTFDSNGKAAYLPKGGVYINEHGIKVTRLEYKKNNRFCKILKIYTGLLQTLENAAPDILFIHNLQFLDIFIVIKYLKKHPNVKVFCDNHGDLVNSARSFISKNILHKIIWKHCAHKIEPYTTKFYGVLPCRVDFLKNVYGLPAEKCELLVMGADDDLVAEAANPNVRSEIRKKYGIADDDFLVITGGKIDAFKPQILLLMDAVNRINNPKIKLIIFGSVTKELMPEFNKRLNGEKVQFIGWVLAKDSYQYFAASDLVVFPGTHSVFWEQVAAQGIPMLCKKWNGATHVDLGGNVHFLTKDSSEEIQNEIEHLLDEPSEYMKMKTVASERGMKEFSYKDIARRSVIF